MNPKTALIIDSFFPSCILFILLSHSLAEDIVGCGGFVKSDIDISKAQVQVKLFTRQGSLKDHTECAPKNGYYFLPIYDKGEYVLKIEPPRGWTFSPTEVPVSFDGTTDPCSLNTDINFEFKGFSIYGKVFSIGSSKGPEGVEVKVFKEKTEVGATFTGKDGHFEFPSLTPGQYRILATHPRWHLSSAEALVVVSNGNGNVKDGSLIVSGYDVSGLVTSDGEPISGVELVLFQVDYKEGTPVPIIDGCSKQVLPGYKPSGSTERGTRQVCHIQSDSKGHFTFAPLPPGHYKVEPFYQGPQNLRFELEPKVLHFTVSHDSVNLPTAFQIKGFTVGGRVLYTPDGPGVPHAYVLFNNQVKAETDKNGNYQLDAVQTGTYSLEAASDKLSFLSVDVKISPNMAHLPDLIPWGFEVCGRITPPRLDDNRPRTVLLSGDKAFSEILSRAEADSAGLYCFHLKPGTYYASVQTSNEEKAKGLQYAPLVREVKVIDRPVNVGLDFSQLKARVRGRVTCIQRCSDISIQLIPLSPGSSVQTIKVEDNGSYENSEVLLGSYQVAVVREDYCWESSQHELDVASAEVTVPLFKQVGFAVKVFSSHDASIVYDLKTELPSSNSVKNVTTVKKGHSRVCVPIPGSYQLHGVGCHVFAEPTVLTWDTNNPSKHVTLTAVGHTISGWIQSDTQVEGLLLKIEHTNGTLVELQGPLKAKQDGTKWRYDFSVVALEGLEYQLIPQSSALLFSPSEVLLPKFTDCADGVVKIDAYLGHIVSGEVVPAISGVVVSVVEDDSLEPNSKPKVVAQVETDHKGSYHVGPLQPGTKYRVEAEKEGYVMTGPDSKNKIYARKLAEVVAIVKDRADGAPLQGVLLSLSGGANYRRNSQTGSDGQMSFKSLSPGEYFLRPMLKEYRFQPSSMQFEVKEGDTVNLKLHGDRVAVSAFGIVTSLSREPEAGVLVEAVGVDNENQKCSHLQEEAITEQNGQFRIRGLQPQCNYIVRMKPGSETNKHIYRATPESIALQAVDSDIKNLKLTAFRPIANTEVVAIVRPSSNTPDLLRSVKLRLCREEAPDSPVHVIKLDSVVAAQGSRLFEFNAAGVVVHFPMIPADGRGYFVQLESSLSPSAYEYSSQAIHFRANVSFQYVSFTFDPHPRFVDQDMNQGPIFLLPVIIIAGLLYSNRVQVAPLLKRCIQGRVFVWKSTNDGSERGSARERSAYREKTTFRERDITPDSSDGAVVEPVSKRRTKPRKT